MKRFFYLLLIFPLAFANAQQATFLRVYNTKGEKINRGYLFQLTDTSITLTRKREIFTETPVSEINFIKSKRTTGHRILVTTASVVGVVAIVVVIVWANKNGHGSRPGFFNSSRRKKNESVKPVPPPKPFKRYEVGGNTQTWEQQKGRLALLL